jgi:hypothetical protein
MRRFAGVASTLFSTLMLPACGGGTEKLPDAGQLPDGAQTVDGVPVGPVTVTTHVLCCDADAGATLGKVPVVAINPDGRVAGMGDTDANGDITFDAVEAGASITAIYAADGGEGGGAQLQTVAAVEPGDHLHFGEGYFRANQTAGVDGTLTINFPAVTNGYYYNVVGPCGGAGVYAPETTSTLYAYSYCAPATADLVFLAYDSNFYLLQSAVLPDASMTTGTLSLPAWTPAATVTTQMTGIPSPVNDVYLGTYAVFDYGNAGNNFYIQPDGGTAETSFAVPVNGARLTTYAEIYRDGPFGSQEHSIASAATATSVALPTRTMPWIGPVLASGIDSRVTWAQNGDGGDAQVGYVDWSRCDGGEGECTYFDWTILAPPGVDTFTWGTFPAALAEFLPTEADFVDGEVQAVDLSDVDGYAAMRALPIWTAECPSCAVAAGEHPQSAVSYSGDGGEGFSSKLTGWLPFSVAHAHGVPRHHRR